MLRTNGKSVSSDLYLYRPMGSTLRPECAAINLKMDEIKEIDR